VRERTDVDPMTSGWRGKGSSGEFWIFPRETTEPGATNRVSSFAAT